LRVTYAMFIQERQPLVAMAGWSAQSVLVHGFLLKHLTSPRSRFASYSDLFTVNGIKGRTGCLSNSCGRSDRELKGLRTCVYRIVFPIPSIVLEYEKEVLLKRLRSAFQA